MNLGFRRIVVPDQPQVLVPVSEVPDQVPSVDSDLATPAAASSDAVKVSDHAQYAGLSPKFLLAGRAVFTVSNPKGDHYTFRVKKVESEWPVGSGTLTTTYFMSVKSTVGKYPYAYIGLLNKDTGGVKCTANSEFLPGTKEYNVAVWAAQTVIAQKFLPEGYKIEHAGRCGKCGKELTDPVSIERGIGPDCWEMLS